MRRFVSPLTAAIAVAAVLVGIVITVGSGGQRALALRPEPSLDAASGPELLAELDKVGAENPERVTQIVARLKERRGEIPPRDLVAAIRDPRRSQATRELTVDLLAGPPEHARVTPDVRGLLRDAQLEPALKARIVASYDFGAEDRALLRSLASGPEDPVAFHALRKLGSVDASAACNLALTSLASGEACSDSKLSAAYKVLIRTGVIRSDRAVRGALLRHLASVLESTHASEQLQDSAAFALSDMRSLDALRMLLESRGTDRIVQVGAVDQNALVIKSALENDPDEPTIELAVRAMELYPVVEIAAPLRLARAKVISPALIRRTDAVLERIAREGVHLNPRWTED